MNINPAGPSSGRMDMLNPPALFLNTAPTWPAAPSNTARKRGLGVRAQADLEAMAAEIRAAGSTVAIAELCGVTPAHYERRFRELATAAGWESLTPDDLLANRPTPERRGGHRRGEVFEGEDAQIGGRVRIETKAKAVQARAKAGLSWEQFVRGASEHLLAGGVFLTLDSQTVQD